MDLGNGQVVLEEAYDEKYEPTEEEILQYCEVIGLDPNTEGDLMYLAKEGTKAPLPPGWKPVEDTASGRVYYFNFRTNERTWDHPSDGVYRQALAEERKKRGRMDGGVGSKKKGSKKTGKVKKTPIGTEAQMTNVPTPGPLNPLSSGGGLAPLGPVRGLPPLKVGRGTLAPLQPPLGMAPGVRGIPPSTHAPPLSTTAPLATSTYQSAPFSITQPHMSTAHPLNPLQGEKGRGVVGATRGRGDVGASSKRDFLGPVELGKNLHISTHFEEEDEEESSSGISKDKFQRHNLLDNEDLGIESPEELHSSEAADSSEELRKLLESEGEEAEDGAREEERPMAPLGRIPLNTGFSPTHGAPLSPLLSPPVPSSLSPLPTGPHRQPQSQALVSPTTNPRTDLQAPATNIGAAPPKASSVITTRGLPTTLSPSITPPPGMKMATTMATATPGLLRNSRDTPTTTASGVKSMTSTVEEKSATKTDKNSAIPRPPIPSSAVAGLTSGGPTRSTMAQMKSSEQGQEVLAHSQEAIRATEEENKQQLERMRKEHEVAVKKLKEQLSSELERERETARKERRAEVERVKKEGDNEVERVRREGKAELERVRRSVEEERAKEEKDMRDRKLKNMSELKETLKEEEEEEEARLVEEKEDNLRRIRQKIVSEREKEEARLRQEAARSRQELIEQLATEKSEEEARLQSVASKEMSEAQAEAERKGETEREEVKKELQRQLQVFREEQEDRHNKEKAEIEENLREQLQALKHEEQLKVQAELERKQAAEEEREKAVQKQQQDIATLQQELAAEFEEKRSELQVQHHATLETLKRELEAATSSAKSEHQSKVKEERDRMKSEFESLSVTLRKEHEECVEQLKRELATSEGQYREQSQIQLEKLRELQADYDQKCSELQQLQQDLEAQSQQVERQRRRQVEDRARLNPREHSRGRREHNRKLDDRDNPLLSAVDDPTCSSEHVPVVSPSFPLSPSVAHEQKPHGGGRGPPDSRERDMVGSHDPKSGEDWSETSSVGSMQLEELEPPPSSSQTPNIRDNLASIRLTLEQNQRTLLKVLAEEQSVVARECNADQTGPGKGGEDGEVVAGKAGDRRRTEESGRRSRAKSKKTLSTKPPKAEKDMFPTTTIKSKLKEEVRALGELERKLHSSRQLLFSREQDLHSLHSHLSETSDGENSRNGRVKRQLSPRPTAAERRETASETRDPNRTPMTRGSRASSVPRTPLARKPPLKQYAGSRFIASSEGGDRRGGRREERGRRGEDTGHTQRGGTQEREREIRTPASAELRLESSGSESEEEEMSESSASDIESPTPSEHVSTNQEDQLESQREMVKSLNSINRQLRQLTSQISQGSTHPPGLPSKPTTPTYYYPTTPPAIPSARWAEPVMRGMIPTPHVQSQQRRGSRESRRTLAPTARHHFSHGRSGDGHVTTSPAHMYPGYSGGVFRADWLDEFQTQFPAYPRLPATPLASPQQPLAPPGPYALPHAQLVMDSDRNIHLVHM